MEYDLAALTKALKHTIKGMNQESADSWVPKFQDIYQVGMGTGISAAFLRYLTEVTGVNMRELPTKVPNFAQISKDRTEQVYQKLAAKLADHTSQDYEIMDTRLSGQIMGAKGAKTWAEANASTKSNLTVEDLINVYFYGYQYGFQISFWAGLVEYDFAYKDRKLTQKEGADLAQAAAVAATNEQLQTTLESESALAQVYYYIQNASL